MSQTWYSLPLGDGIMEAGASEEIRTAFEPVFDSLRRPPGMAVFKRFDPQNRLQCEVTAFFSPLAAQLAETLGAVPCRKPQRAGLILLAGEESCWTELFPEV
jgi:hypothetical protein